MWWWGIDGARYAVFRDPAVWNLRGGLASRGIAQARQAHQAPRTAFSGSDRLTSAPRPSRDARGVAQPELATRHLR